MPRIGSRFLSWWRLSALTASCLCVCACWLGSANAATSTGLELVSVGEAVELQPNGKVVAAGLTQPCRQIYERCAGRSIFVARYRRSGKLDKGFGGGDGLTLIPIGPQTVQVAGLALQPDGRVVVGGGAQAASLAGDQLIVARLTADGELDHTFGAGGTATLPTESFGAGATNAIAVAPDGAILAAGYAPDPAGSKLGVARFLSDGTPDPGFGAGGIASVRVDESGGSESANAIALRPDGRIVLAGQAGRAEIAPTSPSFAAAQLLPDGSPDSSFAGDGSVSAYPLPPGTGAGARVGANALGLTEDGGIVLAGLRSPPLINGCAPTTLAALTSNGAPDTSFSDDGLATAKMSCSIPSDLALTPQQRVLVTGGTFGGTLTPGDRDAVNLLRFAADGRRDRTFADDGRLERRLLHSSSGSFAVTADDRGSLFATGYVVSDHCWTGHGTETFTCRALAIIGMRPNGKPDRGFGAHGLVTLPRLCESGKRCG